MGGAFVAVADDASAVYWNPAGLVLGGSYFSMVLDNNLSEVEPDDPRTGGRQSASLIAVSTLPVGVSYYRLSSSTLRQSAALGTARLDRLTTHHAGVTLVQQVGDHIAIGSTLKWVHGFAASGIVPAGDRDDLLDGAGDLPEHSTNKFDMDVGVMALVGKFRAGVTLRNLIEPDFTTASGSLLTLKRRTRAGFSYVGVAGLIVAADIDVERADGALGEIRDLATGAEAKLWPRVDRPQRFPLQHYRRRARRTCPGLQPRRNVRHLSIPARRRPGHVRLTSRETAAGASPRAWCISDSQRGPATY